MASSKKTGRLAYLDWVRGLAAVIMLQGHVFHSFLKPELREGSAYMLSQFLGGMPPAMFLFLTGVTLAFLMDSREKQGLKASARIVAALRRGGYLFSLAFLFRIQLWIFGFPAAWQDLLKVDILNCMGFAIAVMSLMAFFTTADRVRLCAILGLAIAGVSPMVSELDWSGMPWPLRHYLVPDFNYFGFFPWAAYLAFGLSAGSLLRILRPEQLERAMQWFALAGMALATVSLYFSNLPYSLYPKSDFWLNSPAQVLIKLGVILVIVAFAYLWLQYGAKPGWSWVRQFGTTSLLVYWVHIELVYGRWLPFCKNNLDVSQTTIAAVLVIALMLALAAAKTYRKDWIPVVSAWWWNLNPRPGRVPGD